MENMEKEIEEKEIITEEYIDESDTENKKYDESRIYYVYEHIRLDNNTCFYIGKGKNGRKDLPNRNPTHDSICKEHGYKVVIIKKGLNEKEAFKLEEDLIRCYVFKMGYGICIKGHMNNNKFLTNRTWGGEGTSGHKCSEETKEKMRESHKGIKCSDETRQKMSEARKGEKNGMWGKHHSKESKLKNSKSRKGKRTGESHPMYGKHYSEEHNKKISETMSKKVICITTGKIFNSIKDACNYYKCGHICDNCRGKNKYAGKLKDGTELKWKYLKDYNNEFKGILINPWNKGKKLFEEYKLKRGEAMSKKVICITTGETFNSMKDAGYHYGISPDTISCCCRGKRKSSGVLNHVPLQWKYSEDDDNESKAV